MRSETVKDILCGILGCAAVLGYLYAYDDYCFKNTKGFYKYSPWAQAAKEGPRLDLRGTGIYAGVDGP